MPAAAAQLNCMRSSNASVTASCERGLHIKWRITGEAKMTIHSRDGSAGHENTASRWLSQWFRNPVVLAGCMADMVAAGTNMHAQ